MRKLLAIIRREYVQRLCSKAFIISTVISPVMTLGLMFLPGIIFSIKTGEPVRLAVVDQSGKLSEQIRQSLASSGEEAEGGDGEQSAAANRKGEAPEERMRRAARGQSFLVQEVKPAEGRTLEDIKRELSERVRKDELDGYIIVAADALRSGKVEYYGQNVGDVVVRSQLEERLNRALFEQRLAEANLNRQLVREMSRRADITTIKVSAEGEEKDSGGSFLVVMTIGVFILLMITMYGQTILTAVIEEKETRMAEMLFSSVRTFPLMMGKLLGVSLLALTQYLLWGAVFALLSLYGAGSLGAGGMTFVPAGVGWSLIAYFIIFSMMGYFIYSTFYLLVGAMVTTTQEGGQVALPVTFLLIASYMLIFPVIRAPDSSFAFWISLVPFFSPIIMPIRIVTQTPPFWEIALSLLIGYTTVVLLIWVAARVYRIGMLMYGKRATIPEMLRWVRQA